MRRRRTTLPLLSIPATLQLFLPKINSEDCYVHMSSPLPVIASQRSAD
jgi:hypothetical protein